MKTESLLRAVRRLERKSAPPALPWSHVDMEYLEAVRQKVIELREPGRTVDWKEFRREYDRTHPSRPRREAPPAHVAEALAKLKERVRRAREEESHENAAAGSPGPQA